MKGQLKFPDATDFCTVAYAAEAIGMSMRQVRRLCQLGTLRTVQPRVGRRESGRYKAVLLVADVEAYAAAYRLVKTSEPAA